MSGSDPFVMAFVFLTAAVISVPIAKRLGLGSVLGYLVAGIVIGPFGLGLVGAEGEDLMHFAEFGVVIMLFLVGLELEPSLLWRLRLPILGLGGLQVVLTTAVGAGIGVATGLPVREAVAVGMIFALSSTAIVLSTIAEKGLSKTDGGRSAFAVLLFQDIAVIPMLAIFPLLASHRHGDAHGGGHGGASWVEGLPAWQQTLLVLAIVIAIVVAGHYLVKPAFRWIARTRLREIFIAAALLLVVGIAIVMTRVGLSPALGTFIAGVVLSGSEYRHELEADIDPVKGLLLGLFFLSVGATIDFAVAAEQPLPIAGVVVGLLLGKGILLYALARAFRLGVDQAVFFAFALAQGGEFAFVLFSAATGAGVLEPATVAPLVVAVAISMALTPISLTLWEKLLQPRIGTKEAVEGGDYDDVAAEGAVIMAGFGRFGQIAARLLDAQRIPVTVLEADSEQVELLRRFGRKVYYGDASRADLLESAGAAEAKLLILAIDRPEKTLEIVHTARRHFPQLQIVARARGRVDAYDLVEAGVDHVFRETFDAALEAGVTSLTILGERAYRARRAALRFRKNDEALLRRLAGGHRADDFIDRVKAANAEAEAILREDLGRDPARMDDHSWDTESLARDFGDRS